MNFFKRLLGKPGKDDASGERPAAQDTGGAVFNIEPFDYEVRMVHLPERGSPQVWKSRSMYADPKYVYITPPPEWNGEIPTSQPVTLYFMTEARATEFDAVLLAHREHGELLVRVERPEKMAWKTKDGAPVNQKRKFVRIEVSLPTHLALIVPTLGGSTLKVDEPHDARMIDLSLEGCLLLSNFEPALQRLVEVRVLGPVFPLSVQGKVVRVQLGMTQGYQYTIAIVFQSMTQVTKDMIGRYIVDRQREHR
ncbi:MAG: PilZ domain-containing protein [Proteobacteria bacterium]|nr:PilZ domain-containing protein [Pseudomonadota bacterium]